MPRTSGERQELPSKEGTAFSMVYHRGNVEGKRSGSSDSCIGKKSWKVMMRKTTVRMFFSMAERQTRGVVDPSGNPSTLQMSQDQLRFREEESGIQMLS